VALATGSISGVVDSTGHRGRDVPLSCDLTWAARISRLRSRSSSNESSVRLRINSTVVESGKVISSLTRDSGHDSPKVSRRSVQYNPFARRSGNRIDELDVGDSTNIAHLTAEVNRGVVVKATRVLRITRRVELFAVVVLDWYILRWLIV
jgi:hypothetical protein